MTPGEPTIVVTRPLLDETEKALAAIAPCYTIGPGQLRRGHPRLRDATVLVTLPNDPVDAAALAQLGCAVLVANHAVGFDNIDLAAAEALGIYVSNTPDVLTEATADFTFALLLAAARRLGEGERRVRSGQPWSWAVDFMLGSEVHHKTIGIVGFGRIGRAVARRALGFDMEVLVTDVTSGPDAEAPVGRRATLETLLAESDFVSLHVPLTPQTRHLINASTLAIMKPSAVLINTARGPVVDEAALAAALSARRISAAALDVYEREPDVNEALLAQENVVLAPHLGSATRETRRAMGLQVIDSVERILRGELPRFLVNSPPAPRLLAPRLFQPPPTC